MIDLQRFQEILARYKKDFVSFIWKGEKYKWEAVKCFQDHWDVGAENFAEMLKQSFANTYNLLASHMNYPASSIVEFAEKYPEEVRAMFIDLFDESKEVFERIAAFKSKASEILPRMNWGQAQHYQHENILVKRSHETGALSRHRIEELHHRKTDFHVCDLTCKVYD